MKRLPLLLTSIACVSAAAASSYLVKGTVLDLQDQPNIGVLCKTYCIADSTATSISTATGKEGEFEMPLSKAGEYRLELSGIGMKDTSLVYTVNPQDSVTVLPPITLETDAETLNEVVVTAVRPIIQSDGATLTYNVEDDPTSKSNSTLEMLRKVPMVTVDAEDNIKIKGESNFKIYVNGKEDPMMSSDPKNVLKALPASTIKKFEVITEPGAKYSAEGVGGILNIITVAPTSVEGYLANISGTFGNRMWGLTGYGRTKVNKITASANVSYYGNSVSRMAQEREIDITYTDPEEIARRLQISDGGKPTNGNWNANLNVSWEPDTLNLFTLSGYIGQYTYNTRAHEKTYAFGLDENTIWDYRSVNRDKYSGLWSGFTASYQHNFPGEGHNITMSYMLNYGWNKNYTSFGYEEIFNLPGVAQTNANKERSSNLEHTAQIDYTLPFLSKYKLEAGAKANWRPNTSLKETLYGPDRDQLQVFDPATVKLRQVNDVIAAYLSLNGTWSKFTGKAGVRYEHTRLGAKYRLGDYPDYMTKLNDVVPNAAFSYNFSHASSMRLALQMRISRPNASQLNPYEYSSAPGMVNTGNPDLKSSKFNNLNLTYSNYGMKFGGSVSLGYSQNDNSIEQYFYQEEGTFYTSYMNIGHVRKWSIDLNGNWSITNNLRLSLSGTARYESYFANLGTQGDVRKKGWVGNYNVSVDYTTPSKIRFSAYAGGMTKWLSLQIDGDGWDYHGLSISRSFLKEDRLNLTLQGNNFFHPTNKMTFNVVSDGMVGVQKMKMPMWSVNFSISYRFGGLRADVKQTANRLEAGDMPQGAPASGLKN